jgi:hypothetical protein
MVPLLPVWLGVMLIVALNIMELLPGVTTVNSKMAEQIHDASGRRPWHSFSTVSNDSAEIVS